MEGISNMNDKEEILKKINKLDRRMVKVGGLGALVIGKEIEDLTKQYYKAINKEYTPPNKENN